MTTTQEDRFAQDMAPYIERGNKCALWGKDVAHMSRDELIGFIGFLDELVQLERGGCLDM